MTNGLNTSGTVGQTVISVQQLIDHGARRAGKLAEELTVEQVSSARDSLYYLLSSLTNYGINYWCIDRIVVGLLPNKYEYYLPVGSNDILNANYRTLTSVTTGYNSSSGVTSNAFDGIGDSVCQLSTNTGYIGIANGTGNPVYISTVGILPAVSGSVTITIEASEDGSTWAAVESPGAVTWTAGTWIYYELDPSTTVPYWRIKQSAGVNMGFLQVVFGTMPIAIPMARMNRDDYSNLPNRAFTSERPLQYWFNRTINQPVMNLWPVPNSIQPQLEIWVSRYIQDVGQLNGQLEIPQRWYMAIQNGLAHQMSLELPGVDAARIAYLEGQWEKHFALAESEERDKSPIYLVSNISAYTR